jgi:hypothetical protein
VVANELDVGIVSLPVREREPAVTLLQRDELVTIGPPERRSPRGRRMKPVELAPRTADLLRAGRDPPACTPPPGCGSSAVSPRYGVHGDPGDRAARYVRNAVVLRRLAENSLAAHKQTREEPELKAWRSASLAESTGGRHRR